MSRKSRTLHQSSPVRFVLAPRYFTYVEKTIIIRSRRRVRSFDHNEFTIIEDVLYR